MQSEPSTNTLRLSVAICPPGLAFYFCFLSSRLRWVGDGRECEHDSLLRLHSLPGAPFLFDHTGHQKLYNHLKRCSGDILQQRLRSPKKSLLLSLNSWPFWLFLWWLFLRGSFFSLQKFLLLGHVCDQGGPIHWWFCSRHFVPDFFCFP